MCLALLAYPYALAVVVWGAAVAYTPGAVARRRLLAAAVGCPVTGWLLGLGSAVGGDYLRIADQVAIATFGVIALGYLEASAAIVLRAYQAPTSEPHGFPIEPKHLPNSGSAVGPTPGGPI